MGSDDSPKQVTAQAGRHRPKKARRLCWFSKYSLMKTSSVNGGNAAFLAGLLDVQEPLRIFRLVLCYAIIRLRSI